MGQCQIHWAADNDTIFQVEPQSSLSTLPVSTSSSQKSRPVQSGNHYTFGKNMSSYNNFICHSKKSCRMLTRFEVSVSIMSHHIAAMLQGLATVLRNLTV